MGDPFLPDADIGQLLRQLDELIAEAKTLRENIQRTARERKNSVWPDRRDPTRSQAPRSDDRRGRTK